MDTVECILQHLRPKQVIESFGWHCCRNAKGKCTKVITRWKSTDTVVFVLQIGLGMFTILKRETINRAIKKGATTSLPFCDGRKKGCRQYMKEIY